MAFREVHARARQHNGAEQADDRLETFKKLAATLKEQQVGVKQRSTAPDVPLSVPTWRLSVSSTCWPKSDPWQG